MVQIKDIIDTFPANQKIYIEDLESDYVYFKGTVREFVKLNPDCRETATVDIKSIATGITELLDPCGIVIYI